MVLGLKFTCTCHQAKITLCFQTPLVAPIDQKICTGGFLNTLNPNLLSDLLPDHSNNTSYKKAYPVDERQEYSIQRRVPCTLLWQ